jgi:predicted nuclease of predicted toxin-antitoxin system
MKLLFDQNISFRIIKLISNHFSDCNQVRFLGLENSKDIEIWKFAKEKGFVIVTFDFDFINFSNLYGQPPKVIWLKIGNHSTKAIADCLIQKTDKIRDFIKSEDFRNVAVLEINNSL